MSKRRFFFLFAFLWLCLVLHGCLGVKGKLVVAINPKYQPYEYKENGELKGLDVEIAKLIANQMGKKLKFLEVEDFDSVIPAVVDNQADIALSGITVTDEREKIVNFSNSYVRATQSVVVKKNSDIRKIADLKDKKIGVQTGTTADIYCTDEFGENNLQRYYEYDSEIDSLKKQEVDAVVLETDVAKNFVKEDNEIIMLDDVYCEEEYAVVINKDKKDLLEQINNILSEIKSSGELDDIVKKYIK